MAFQVSDGLLWVERVAVLAFFFEKQLDEVSAEVLRPTFPFPFRQSTIEQSGVLPFQSRGNTDVFSHSLWQSPQSCAGTLLENGPNTTEDQTKMTG